MTQKNIWKSVFSFKMLSMLLLGYASGLPLLLTGSTLQAWLKDSGIDRTDIGLISLLGLPYTLKFIWAPLLDRFKLPFLGRRRGWILFFQILLCVVLFLMSFGVPTQNLYALGVVAFFVALLSASQDIVIDAYRREVLEESELGLGSSLYVNGYRLAMMISGALALYLADHLSWKSVYQIMTIAMAINILVTLFLPKEKIDDISPRTLKEAVWGPLQEFFQRKGAMVVLSFILLYKVGDSMAANMSIPFIMDLGYSKTDIAAVAKTFGMFATILGGVVGGALLLKFELKKSLMWFGLLQAISTLGFSILPSLPFQMSSLALVIAFENLASGMGTAAYAGYMASQTHRAFTATQFALLSSLMGVPRVILASPTGWMSKIMGWELFFVFCTLIAIPGLFLIYKFPKSPTSS